MWSQNHSPHSRPSNSPSSGARPQMNPTYPSYMPQVNHHPRPPPQQLQQHQNQSSYPGSPSTSTSFPLPSPSQYVVGQHYQTSHSQQQQQQQQPHHGHQQQRPYRPALQVSRPPPPSSPLPGNPHSYPGNGRRPQPASASMTMPVPAHWSPSPPLQHSAHVPLNQPRPASQQSGGSDAHLQGQGSGTYRYSSGNSRIPSSGGAPPPLPTHPHSQPTSPAHLVSPPPPLPAKDPLIDDEADFQAALLASQLSAQEEASFRRSAEAEELRKLQELHDEEQIERIRRDQERRRKEEEEMRLVMEQSKEDEERRDQEARDVEARALEESRVQAAREALRRIEEEEEEMRKVMEASLREEWERRREAEEEELQTVERIRREIEAQRALADAGPSYTAIAGQGGSASSGVLGSSESDSLPVPSDSSRSRRPLPNPPMVGSAATPTSHQSTPPLQVPSPAAAFQITYEASTSNDLTRDEDPLGDDDGDDPFADSAEAPPAYDNVGADRPPEAPSRAPTGFWDEARARRIREQRAAARNGSGGADTQLVVHVATDPLEEKKRMEAAGRTDRDPTEGLTSGSSSNSERNPARTRPFSRGQARPILASMPEVPQIGSQPPSRPDASPLQKDVSPAGSAVSGTDVLRMGRQDSRSSLRSTASRHTTSSTHSNSISSTARTLQTTAADSHSDFEKTGRLSRERTSSPAVVDSFASRTPVFGQKAPLGIDWGYSPTAFARKLYPGSFSNSRNNSFAGGQIGDQTANSEEDETRSKTRFPSIITLGAMRATSNASQTEEQSYPYFTIRCGSWKILLRSLAWLGNTRIEAGPQEVADAAELHRIPLLKAEVEFVTPATSKGSTTERLALQQLSVGARTDELLARAGQGVSSRPTACVSVCISLCQQDIKGRTHQHGSGPSEPSHAYREGARKQAERELDLEYMKRGSDRRVLNLPPSSMGIGPVISSYSLTYQFSPAQIAQETRPGLDLPTSLIQLAEHLQKAHRYSAACPSSGYTARHSPRDLYHTIEAHDDKYIGKLQRETIYQQTQAASSGSRGNSVAIGLIYTHLESTSSPNPLPSETGSSTAPLSRETRLLPLSSIGPESAPLLLWDESSLGHPSSSSTATSSGQNPLLTSLSYNSLGTNGGSMNDEGVEMERSGLGRMKDRVKKKLKGRQGDVGDGEELANWITPLDLSEVGGGEEEGRERSMSREGSSRSVVEG